MSLTTGRLMLIPAIALLAIATLGCQGRDSEEATDDTARQISNDELAGMTLALADFGADYDDFEADDDNGPRTADQIAEEDFDPEDERADLERFGWESGYQEFYASLQAADEGSGVVAVGTTVNLFDTAEAAAGYLEDSRGELTTQVGRSNKGVTVVEIRQFDADIADGAAGAVFHGSVETEQGSSMPLWMSAIMFRHGRLVAVLGVYSFEERELQDTLKELALETDQKIGSVLKSTAPS